MKCTRNSLSLVLPKGSPPRSLSKSLLGKLGVATAVEGVVAGMVGAVQA